MANVEPRNAVPGGSVTVTFQSMPRPATCSLLVDLPGDIPSLSLGAQTGVSLGPDMGYGMSWTFTVPGETPAGNGAVWPQCTYPGYEFPQEDLGFNIVLP